MSCPHSMIPHSDQELLTDILNYHPEEDPTTLLSLAYNRIQELREALIEISELGECTDGVSWLTCKMESTARKALR